jgi:hypothetical protein
MYSIYVTYWRSGPRKKKIRETKWEMGENISKYVVSGRNILYSYLMGSPGAQVAPQSLYYFVGRSHFSMPTSARFGQGLRNEASGTKFASFS